MQTTIKQLAHQFFSEIQAIRHHIHAHPELSFQEFETAQFISNKLNEFGIEHKTGVAGTGIVALIKGKNPDHKCIALRADMDALPILEANDCSYASKNKGVMHACGHDVHSACLLGAAKILHATKDNWEGTIKLLFQPGEEKHPGGASLMIADKALENPKPNAIYALHVYPHLPVGYVGFKSGQYMASADEIYITIKGKGGHAALPHQTIDPISIAAQVLVALQQIVSRKANPLIPSVLSFGKIEGGFATNVIPEEVKILGTFRTMDETWRAEAHQLIKEITEGICQSYGAKADVEIPKGYPSLYNDPTLTEQAITWAADFLGKEQVVTLDKRMAGEDFSFYTQHMPGCFFRIGTNTDNEKFTAPVHNDRFDIDERALEIGMSMMAWFAINALNTK